MVVQSLFISTPYLGYMIQFDEYFYYFRDGWNGVVGGSCFMIVGTGTSKTPQTSDGMPKMENQIKEDLGFF